MLHSMQIMAHVPTVTTAYLQPPTLPDSAAESTQELIVQWCWSQHDFHCDGQLRTVGIMSKVPNAGHMWRTCLPLSFQAFTDDLIQLDMLMTALRQTHAAR